MMVYMTTTRARLSEAQLGAWRAFLRAHAQITRRLEHELLTEQDIPLASYDVLLQLAEAPGQRLRMTQLADSVLLSRSGLTRLVDRLERDGLVTRASCPGDARGTNAVLTEAGRDRLRAAAPTHLRGIAEHVTGRLSDDEVTLLKELMSKLLVGPMTPPEGGCGGAEGL
jgi:DNA-binding MarR family transcriptional regulator